MRLDAQNIACDGRGCAVIYRLRGERWNDVPRSTDAVVPVSADDLPRGWEVHGVAGIYCASCAAAMRRAEQVRAGVAAARRVRLERLRAAHD